MDTGNLIAFIKKFSFGRLIACGILLMILNAYAPGHQGKLGARGRLLRLKGHS